VLHCKFKVNTGIIMAKEETFTFRLEEELKQDFIKVSEKLDIPAAMLLRQYMKQVIEREKEKAGK
jgi:antitoxin component of RelBE/YafQ-DinJ toxin-antitoxin module